MKTDTKTNENGNKSKPLFCDVLINCKEGTIVAFKEKERSTWFTGKIINFFEPNSKYNECDEYLVSIYLNIPIEPQWYDGEQTVYYLDDISDLVILENIA